MSADVSRSNGGDALTPDETARLDGPRHIFELLGQMQERCHALDGLTAGLEQTDPELFVAIRKAQHWVQVAGEHAAAHLASEEKNDGRSQRTLAGHLLRATRREKPR